MLNSKTSSLSSYYKFHSWIYDATRWSFLFGRKTSFAYLPFDQDAAIQILEVGCGTGLVLKQLQKRFPKAQIIGLDLSKDMVKRAHKKTKSYPNVKVLHQAFDQRFLSDKSFDLILMSYSISMMEPYWKKLEKPTINNLKDGGLFQIVDFHRSSFPWFTTWMSMNHVYMQGHWPSWTTQNFYTKTNEIKKAYAGLWEYRIWVGQKRSLPGNID